jgi:hypothetical protein
MLRSLQHLSPEHQQATLDALEAMPGKIPDASTNEQLWKLLQSELRRHARFRDKQDWAWPTETSIRIQKVADLLKPDDLVSEHQWLFDIWLPDVSREAGEYSDQVEAADKARASAFNQIYAKMGIGGVKELALVAKFPELVARPLARLISSPQDAFAMIDLLPTGHPNRDGFVFALSVCALEGFKSAWQDSILKHQYPQGWSSSDLASLCLPFPDDPETWAMVESLGVDEVLYEMREA